MKRDKHSSGEACLRSLLREWRCKADIRQEDLATRLGVPQSFISKYESGERLLTFVETVWVCQALGGKMENLLREFLNHHDS